MKYIALIPLLALAGCMTIECPTGTQYTAQGQQQAAAAPRAKPFTKEQIRAMRVEDCIVEYNSAIDNTRPFDHTRRAELRHRLDTCLEKAYN